MCGTPHFHRATFYRTVTHADTIYCCIVPVGTTSKTIKYVLLNDPDSDISLCYTVIEKSTAYLGSDFCTLYISERKTIIIREVESNNLPKMYSNGSLTQLPIVFRQVAISFNGIAKKLSV